jgi:hypothetical protein
MQCNAMRCDATQLSARTLPTDNLKLPTAGNSSSRSLTCNAGGFCGLGAQCTLLHVQGRMHTPLVCCWQGVRVRCGGVGFDKGVRHWDVPWGMLMQQGTHAACVSRVPKCKMIMMTLPARKLLNRCQNLQLMKRHDLVSVNAQLSAAAEATWNESSLTSA